MVITQMILYVLKKKGIIIIMYHSSFQGNSFQKANNAFAQKSINPHITKKGRRTERLAHIYVNQTTINRPCNITYNKKNEEAVTL